LAIGGAVKPYAFGAPLARLWGLAAPPRQAGGYPCRESRKVSSGQSVVQTRSVNVRHIKFWSLQIIVDDGPAELEQGIGATPRPSHLLRFVHAAVDQEVGSAFGELGTNPQANATALGIIGQLSTLVRLLREWVDAQDSSLDTVCSLLQSGHPLKRVRALM
jgi:hypothetical protein